MKKWCVPFLLVATLCTWTSGQAQSCPPTCPIFGGPEQIALVRQTAVDMNAYLDYRSALNEQARYQVTLDKALHLCGNSRSTHCQSLRQNQVELTHYKTQYVIERNRARAQMLADFDMTRYVFDIDTSTTTQPFVTWDTKHLSDSLDTPGRATDAQYEAKKTQLLDKLWANVQIEQTQDASDRAPGTDDAWTQFTLNHSMTWRQL